MPQGESDEGRPEEKEEEKGTSEEQEEEKEEQEEEQEQQEQEKKQQTEEEQSRSKIPDEDSNEEETVSIIEAALFSAGRPLTVPEMEEYMGIHRTEIRRAVKKIRRMYQNRKTAIEIKKIGRKYSMQLKPTYNQYGMQFMDDEIGMDVLKTAALIAYYQPVKQSDLKKMVGDKVYEHVDKLTEMDLILSERDGRTYSLRTSPKFQEYFGLEAKDRNELKKKMAQKVGIK